MSQGRLCFHRGVFVRTARLSRSEVLKQVFQDRIFSESQEVAALTSLQPRFIPGFDETRFRFLKKIAQDVDDEAIRSFLSANQTQVPIKSIYEELKDVIVIEDDDLRTIMESIDRSWTGFYKKYPNSKGIVH